MTARSLRPWVWSALAVLLCFAGPAVEVEGRSPFGDDDPYQVGLHSPRLTTPQWVGEPGVEAVVILGIDDLAGNVAGYDKFLAPIFERLKRVDGRTPVSVMTCRVAAEDRTVERWLKAGVSIEDHTLDHPCPLWTTAGFDAASRTVLDGLDRLAAIPQARPTAFRMPCCDSMNSPSPRFYAEIFNAVSPEGHFLTIDSSVMHYFTADDPSLPRTRLLDADGHERFRRYLPPRGFLNTIRDHPYPYVVGRLCWEFPAAVPSDWEGQRRNGSASPKTLDDLKAALDLTVAKQGVFNLIFHPHGWTRSEQVVELIDHAQKAHGPKVKFLTFREAQDRLDTHLLAGQPLRDRAGRDNGVRILDLNADGFQDVVIGNAAVKLTRVWDPATSRFLETAFPLAIVTPDGQDAGVRFGRVGSSRTLVAVAGDDAGASGWAFERGRWVENPALVGNFPGKTGRLLTHQGSRDLGVRFVDLDGDGRDELIAGNRPYVYEDSRGWRASGPPLPEDVAVVDRNGLDDGLRFVDVDEDGRLDLLVSNDRGSAVHLANPSTIGEHAWRLVRSWSRDDRQGLPRLVRDGRNNGAWFRDRHLWVQNETTTGKPDLVDRRSFDEILAGVELGPRSADAALRTIHVPPGFRVELMASEPLVRDPIAFDWGADGKLWVVEMGDYPLGADGKGSAGGSIVVLEDRGGDGKYDTATTFLEGLGFPTGVMPWRNGALISRAPDILFAEDTNGDGRADRVEVLFTGFVPGNPQHRVNGFDLGLDGWVQGANGDSGGTIHANRVGTDTRISGRDFRFDPDTGQFLTESGQTQFGRHRDDFGRWFGNNNSHWGWQIVLPERELARNPSLQLASPRQPLDVDPQLHPDSATLPRFNSPGSANKVTSANSPTPYRDDLFGPGFATSLFVSEPVHNLVRRIILEPQGAAWNGRASFDDEGREFVASTDHWFRPTMLRTGPDGALWIADMYRAVIEHPEWIPDATEAKLDLRAGADRGRIYRVVPVDAPKRATPRLDRMETPALVAALDHPSGWRRDTVQRLLMHQRDPAAIPPLRKLALASARPKTRVQALWTLRTLNGLDAATTELALRDPHPQVRRAAVATADRSLVEPLLALVNDPDPEVRLELALALGDRSGPAAGKALAVLASRDRADPWTRAAVLSSATPHAGVMLAKLFETAGSEGPPAELVAPLLQVAAKSTDPTALDPLVDAVATPSATGFATWQFAAGAGLAESHAGAREKLTGLVEGARKVAADEKAEEPRRLAAIRLLGPLEADRPVLVERLSLREPASVQLEALRSLGRSSDRRTAEALIAGWSGHSPALRGAILDLLLDRPTWTSALLASLEDRCLPPLEIPPAARRRLVEHPDLALRARASALFAQPTSTRVEILAAYRPALASNGDRARGAQVFQKSCVTCHKLGGVGAEVGPDLGALADASPEALLVAILDPNRAFEARYAAYVVHTTDGRVLTGLIASESAGSITLKGTDGREEVIPRSRIEAVSASGKSLMPEGLEKDVSPTDLADLLAHLAASRSSRPGGTAPR